jgi:hypothetical protein
LLLQATAKIQYFLHILVTQSPSQLKEGVMLLTDHAYSRQEKYFEIEREAQRLESLLLVPCAASPLQTSNPGQDNSAPFSNSPAVKNPAAIREHVRAIITILLCLSVLSAIIAPCFLGAQLKAESAAVKGNMRTVQIAAESYASDNNGVYATELSQLLPYFPKGSNSIGGNAGALPINPVSGSSVESVIDGSKMASVERVLDLRTVDTDKSILQAGQIGYFSSGIGKSYAILGADAEARDIPGMGGKVLVLSNVSNQ